MESGRSDKGGGDDRENCVDKTTTNHESGTDDSMQSLRNNRKRNMKKTREELNEKEKERTKRMNNQFDSLRTLLQNSKISTKKDKYSVLKNSYDFILKLRHTLHLTETEISRVCHSSYFSLKSNGSSHTSSLASSDKYKEIFMNSSVAMVVMEFDGKFSLCNHHFTRLTGLSSQSIHSKTIYDCIIPEEVSHLFTIFHQLSSSFISDEPYQTFATFQFAKTSIPIRCSLTVWMFEYVSNPQSLCFQLMLLPLSEVMVGQSISPTLPPPSSISPSSTMSLSTNPQLTHFTSPSSTGTTFIASHLHPLPSPLLPPSLLMRDESSLCSPKECQSPIMFGEGGDDLKSPEGNFKSCDPEVSAPSPLYLPATYQFYRSIPNPCSQTLTQAHQHSSSYSGFASSAELASSYQQPYTPYQQAAIAAGIEVAQYDQDESDDTFENMPDNWFEQEGDEDLEPEEDT